MKRLLLILILTLSFQSSTKANDIRDFEIEGMSIGDSALDFFTKKEIKDKKRNYYKDDEFIPSEFEYLKSFKTYDAIQITYKKNDLSYQIYGLAGFLDFPKNIKDCYKKKDEITDEISSLFPNKQFKHSKIKHRADTSGKSIKTRSEIFLVTGTITVSCDDWSKKIDYMDVLRIDISTNDFDDWIRDKAYK